MQYVFDYSLPLHTKVHVPVALTNSECSLKVIIGSRSDLRKLLNTPQMTLMSETLSRFGLPFPLSRRSFTSLIVLLELYGEVKVECVRVQLSTINIVLRQRYTAWLIKRTLKPYLHESSNPGSTHFRSRTN